MNTLIQYRILMAAPVCDTLPYLGTKLLRHFCVSPSCYGVNKLLLVKIRKETGFPLSHCKKALDLHENDYDKAQEWLQKEAQAHGWAKASKLSSRLTTQGLIGIHIEKNVSNLVEVNCETDFVAKNTDFKSLVMQITKEFASMPWNAPENLEEPIKKVIDKSTLEAMKTSDGKTLSDLVALSIGKIGENIQLSRGVKFACPPSLDLVGYAHPPSDDGVLLGKYAAVVAFKNAKDMDLAHHLSAHIVGMNPETIGSIEDFEEQEQEEAGQLVVEEKNQEYNPDSEEELSDEKIMVTPDNASKVLVHQTFITDQEVKVGEVLKENDLHIIDFIRLECGETRAIES